MPSFFNNLVEQIVQTFSPTAEQEPVIAFIHQFYKEHKLKNGNLPDSSFADYKSYAEYLNSDESFQNIVLLRLTDHNVDKKYYEKDYRFIYFTHNFISHILKSNVPIWEKTFLEVSQCLFHHLDHSNNYVYSPNAHNQFPYALFLTRIDKYLENNPLREDLKTALKLLIRQKNLNKSDTKFNQRLDKTLHAHEPQVFDIQRFIFLKDAIGQIINDFIDGQKTQTYFDELVQLLLVEEFDKVTPTKKWEKRATVFLTQIDKTKLTDFIKNVISATVTHLEQCHKMPDLNHQYFPYPNANNYHNTDNWFSSKNEAVLRRVVWLLPMLSDDADLVEKISNLGLMGHKKYSGIGALLPSVGNACMYALANLPNQKGIPYLTKYNQKITNQTTKKTIEKYLREMAARSGKTTYEMEEEALPTFGFDITHSKSITFGDFIVAVNIVSNTKLQVVWQDVKGKIFKSAPSVLKENFAKELKEFNAQIKLIQEQLVSQAKRIEDMYLLDRQWKFDNWEKTYNQTGVLAYLGQKTIWEFESNEQKTVGIYLNGQFVNALGHSLSIEAEKTTVRLWHPVNSTLQEVSQWRDFMFHHQLTQPFKQAFREVYILTDTEINTKTYSNRFAAHVLKIFQFGALCKQRNWVGFNAFHYSGDTPTKQLKHHNLQVQYWVNHVESDYITTDQVCFLRHNTRLDLVQIPPIIFNEVMRDVDMFVAVCSVGGDPNWHDRGGENRYGHYWHSYSFGDLTESAKVRKEILEKILPKLKIAKVAHLEDKFLVVKGKVRTYKIHLGSTNILMTPNDQYLCIVPDRSTSKEESVYLPFEGDTGLSVIISKAFLLAADDKITDSTILSQIHRK